MDGNIAIFVLVIIVLALITWAWLNSVFAKAAANKAKNEKHQEESQTAFDGLPDFKAGDCYLSTRSTWSIGFDNERKKICFLDESNQPFVFNYTDIMQCDLVQDEVIIFRQSSLGALGSAFGGEIIGEQIGGVLGIGRALGGEIGGFAGAQSAARTEEKRVSTVYLKIIVNNIHTPLFKIYFLNFPIPLPKTHRLYTEAYPQAERWNAIIAGLIRQGNAENNHEALTENISVADELKKLKDLLDQGVITSDDFNKQKTKLIS